MAGSTVAVGSSASGRSLGADVAGFFDGFEGHRVPTTAEIDEALVSGLIAVDTNVLLSLYRYNTRTTDDLLNVLERIGDRLVVPYQVVQEFHRRRLSAIGNPESAARTARDALDKNRRSTTEVLSGLSKQSGLDDATQEGLQAEIDELFARLHETVDRAVPDPIKANTPTSEDRILSRLVRMLDGKVLAKPADENWQALIEEGKRRVAEERPPGYKDADKAESADAPAGDFLVYWQACQAASDRGTDLVIVTGDEKEDWWWKHRSTLIGPRTEMAKEFFDLTGGRRLFLLRPPELLQRSGALDVEVSPTSIEDADRAQTSEEWNGGVWTPEAVVELLARLDAESLPQADVIRAAAASGGTITREAVYDLCGYEPARMLRGFTRPTARITADLLREGVLSSPVEPMLTPMYPNDVRASGFRIPAEVVTIIADLSAETTVAGLATSSISKYQPLTDWLLDHASDSFLVTFEEMERVLGFELAPSARRYTQYWYSAHNSMGKAIRAGGYRPSGVNLEGEQLRLVRR